MDRRHITVNSRELEFLGVLVNRDLQDFRLTEMLSGESMLKMRELLNRLLPVLTNDGDPRRFRVSSVFPGERTCLIGLMLTEDELIYLYTGITILLDLEKIEKRENQTPEYIIKLKEKLEYALETPETPSKA